MDRTVKYRDTYIRGLHSYLQCSMMRLFTLRVAIEFVFYFLTCQSFAVYTLTPEILLRNA